MMKKYLYIVLSIILAVACNNNKIELPEKPKNLIKKDKMIEVLFDMTMMTAAKGNQKHILEKNGVLPEHIVFTKHEIDSTQFALSNEYYSYDIDTYEEIYRAVQQKLANEKVLIDSLVNKGMQERGRSLLDEE